MILLLKLRDAGAKSANGAARAKFSKTNNNLPALTVRNTPAGQRRWGVVQIRLSSRRKDASIRGCQGNSSSSSALDGFLPR